MVIPVDGRRYGCGACLTSLYRHAVSPGHSLPLVVLPLWVSGCGWSDRIVVTVIKAAAPEVDGVPLGPFNVTDAQMAAMLLDAKL